ncbi:MULTISPECIES: dienelactone hydrolase family protein [unclassified Massilia]|uniref:dienelactone hydrolase family protein n=1 Tax=unclassified Massilia TaxID=2609279 RepID=UPI00177EC874|nr:MULTISPECIES: dienelactone hydrolase family protein [unclassified Massilia]MBD8528569.1 dienelactone hydrolase family protein [Massilia sp. CFBP 13647]MBD8671808.1 dienelactone hydrolase family protein [Massilia sp. CFBP 13721]
MVREYPVEIAADGVTAGTALAGVLALPPDPIGVVLFAHGSGSSRHSPRNQAVAAALREAGVATLLLDLLTPAEDALYRNRFDIDVLAARLHAAARWLGTEPLSAPLPLGLFGASTGAAAALRVAADSGSGIAAVVSRGGRPDLAGTALAQVLAPTLLIVGGADTEVLELNRRAFASLQCEKALEVVPGAGHLFEEAGALEQVAEMASDWFVRHCGP